MVRSVTRSSDRWVRPQARAAPPEFVEPDLLATLEQQTPVIENLHTLDDVVAYTPFMRESPLNMYWWVLASFSSVDLRTVNHNSTFYTLELYSFVNVLSVIFFFYLNKKRSPYRYLIPVLGSGEPVAATFIFSSPRCSPVSKTCRAGWPTRCSP